MPPAPFVAALDPIWLAGERLCRMSASVSLKDWIAKPDGPRTLGNMAFRRFGFRNRLFSNRFLTRARLGRRDCLSPTTECDALARASHVAHSSSRRTVAQPDATKRPARMCGGPFLRLRKADGVSFHSLASRCASAICAAVILLAKGTI
jgi:hypothetical protein